MLTSQADHEDLPASGKPLLDSDDDPMVELGGAGTFYSVMCRVCFLDPDVNLI